MLDGVRIQIFTIQFYLIKEVYKFEGPHSIELAPDYKTAATALKNIVMFGAVECDDNEDICCTFNITGYPTVKIFLGGIVIRDVEDPAAEILIAVGFEQSYKEGFVGSNGSSLLSLTFFTMLTLIVSVMI